MKKLLLSAFTALALVACGGGTSNSCSQDCASASKQDNHTEAAVQKAVERAYDYRFFVMNEDNKARNAEIAGEECDEVPESAYDMSAYLTRKFNTVYSQTLNKQMADDNLFLDYDFWINAQDFSEVTGFDVKVTGCSGDRATADVKFENLGSPTTIHLCLEYDKEISDWLISDFIDGEDSSLMDSMIEFLNADQSK